MAISPKKIIILGEIFWSVQPMMAEKKGNEDYKAVALFSHLTNSGFAEPESNSFYV
jgi:hypothetical protein